MDILKIVKTMLGRFSLSEILPYYAYDRQREVYLLSHGVGFIFECFQTWGGTATADSLRGLYYQQFPPGTSLQVMTYASPTVAYVMDAYVNMREERSTKETLIEAARRKRDFVVAGTRDSLLKGYNFRARNFKHVISCVVPCEATPEGYEEGIKTVLKIKPTVFQALNTAHLSPHDMGPDRLLAMLSELLNPGHCHDRRESYQEHVPLRDQLVWADTEVVVELDCMKVDGRYVRSFTVRQ